MDDLIRRNLSPDGRTLHLSRATIPAGLVIPGSVTTLYLSDATIPAGIVIPDSVTTLDLWDATIPAGIVIPGSVTTLDLRAATIPAGIVIPDSVTTLYLSDATIQAGLVIPDSVTTLYLRAATIPDKPLYTCPRGYRLYSLPRSDGDRVFWAGCRTFPTRAAASAHWGAARYPDPARGAAFCAAINAARKGGDNG